MGNARVSETVLKTMIKAGPAAGVPVRYWPVWLKGDQIQFSDSTTRSEPWMLGHGEWVVKIEGRTGCVAVSHCALLDDIEAGKLRGPAHA